MLMRSGLMSIDIVRQYLTNPYTCEKRSVDMKREVFYKGKKIKSKYEVIPEYNKCKIVYDGKESFVEYEQFYENQQLDISKLKVHELCREMGIGLRLISWAIKNASYPISKITIKACAETEDINEFKGENGYKKPRTQDELKKYYKNFSAKQNGKSIEIIVRE